jgi:hypothetical protein
VRLVDHEQHRTPLLAPLPEVVEQRQCDDQLLLGRGEAAEVEHRGIRALGDDVGDGGAAACPDLPVEHGEVLDALGERVMAVAVAAVDLAKHGQELLELAGTHQILQVHEPVVLVAVGDGVEPQHRRLRWQAMSR